MHSQNPLKDQAGFDREIEEILNSPPDHDRSAEGFDFTRFVFPRSIFVERKFLRKAIFRNTTFLANAQFDGAFFAEGADFSSAVFNRAAVFFGSIFARDSSFFNAEFQSTLNFALVRCVGNADFRSSQFQNHADFTSSRFLGSVDFSSSIFATSADFSRMMVGAPLQPDLLEPQNARAAPAIVNFSLVRFNNPESIVFRQVNKSSSQGLRTRFIGSNIEKVRFEDVRWHREKHRTVLQDEIDLKTSDSDGHGTYELVADVYRKFINNFQGNRQYELAEDCFCGAMEMRRLDGNWIQRNVSLLAAYRTLSNYGSDYVRAASWLAIFILIFSCLYPFFGIRIVDSPNVKTTETAAVFYWPTPSPDNAMHLTKTLVGGIWTTLDIATFTRNPAYEPNSRIGRDIAIVEIIVVSTQTGLLLLSIRRRVQR